MNHFKFFSKLIGTILLAVCITLPTSVFADNPTPRELDWTDLIPEGFNPDVLYEKYQKQYDIDNLADDDPRVAELRVKLEIMMQQAPVNDALNGTLIRLPGYVLPLESDGVKTTEFLLVPYYGACIHVPPPPLNQTIYVTTQDKNGAKIRKVFDTVWVTGFIHTEKLSTDVADSGYKILATKVEPYE